MAKSVLTPPVRLLAITFGDTRPAKPQYDLEFSSLDEAYDFFRKEKPTGRWTVWLRGSTGYTFGLDSRLWERGMGRAGKG